MSILINGVPQSRRPEFSAEQERQARAAADRARSAAQQADIANMVRKGALPSRVAPVARVVASTGTSAMESLLAKAGLAPNGAATPWPKDPPPVVASSGTSSMERFLGKRGSAPRHSARAEWREVETRAGAAPAAVPAAVSSGGTMPLPEGVSRVEYDAILQRSGKGAADRFAAARGDTVREQKARGAAAGSPNMRSVSISTMPPAGEVEAAAGSCPADRARQAALALIADAILDPATIRPEDADLTREERAAKILASSGLRAALAAALGVSMHMVRDALLTVADPAKVSPVS